MAIPGMDKLVGLIVTIIVLSVASGHGEWVWKGLAYARHVTLKGSRQPWGCPSIFNRQACTHLTSSGTQK